MLTLYDNDMSTCSQKVRLVLAEKSLAWEDRHLDLRAGDQQAPDYVALNPRAVVPTLVDDGRVIRESNVILEYLDDVCPDPPLRPADAFGCAQVRLWTKRLDEGHHDIATSMLSTGIAFRHQYLAKSEEELEALMAKTPDPAKRERRRSVIQRGTEAPEFETAVSMWVALLDDMEASLSEMTWLAGPDWRRSLRACRDGKRVETVANRGIHAPLAVPSQALAARTSASISFKASAAQFSSSSSAFASFRSSVSNPSP